MNVKRILAGVIAAAVMCGAAPVMNGGQPVGNIEANALAIPIVDRGLCGENLSWSLNAYGVLTIMGRGAMKDYDSWDSSAAPLEKTE